MTEYVPDYHFCCNKGTPKEEREKLNIGDVWINAAVCHNCGDFVRSRNRHDFRTCSCGDVSVDGGSWYGRVLFKDKHKVTFIQEMFGDVDGTKVTKEVKEQIKQENFATMMKVLSEPWKLGDKK